MLNKNKKIAVVERVTGMARKSISGGILVHCKHFLAVLICIPFFFAMTPSSLANHVVMEGGPFLGVVLSITVDSVESNNLYCAAYGGGVFRSRDRGASWTAINQGLPDRQVFALALSPLDSRHLLVGTDRGVFHSTNQGDSWHLLTPALKNRNIRALLIDPRSQNTIYVATDQGVFQGTGKKWKKLSKGLIHSDVRALALSPQGALFAGTFGGIFRKEKNEQAWIPVNNGLEDKKVRALVVDDSYPDTLYAGSALGGVFKSVNGGRQWKPANKGLLNSTILSLIIAPEPHKAIYAGTVDGVFKSADDGSHWFSTGETLAFTVPTLTFDPAEPQRLYASSGGHLFKTTDGGKKWQEVSHQVNYFGPAPLSAKPGGARD